MAKKHKREVDKQLLNSIFELGHEWKQLQSIVEKSIEPTDEGMFRENLAKAKYLYLLQEARRRQISAIRYD